MHLLLARLPSRPQIPQHIARCFLGILLKQHHVGLEISIARSHCIVSHVSIEVVRWGPVIGTQLIICLFQLLRHSNLLCLVDVCHMGQA